jgi:hypothetical protein
MSKPHGKAQFVQYFETRLPSVSQGQWTVETLSVALKPSHTRILSAQGRLLISTNSLRHSLIHGLLSSPSKFRSKITSRMKD